MVTHNNKHPMFKVPRVEKCIKPIMHRDTRLRRRQNMVWRKPVLGKDGIQLVKYKSRGNKFSHGGTRDYGYCQKWDDVQVESCNPKLCEKPWGAMACGAVAMTS